MIKRRTGNWSATTRPTDQSCGCPGSSAGPTKYGWISLAGFVAGYRLDQPRTKIMIGCPPQCSTTEALRVNRCHAVPPGFVPLLHRDTPGQHVAAAEPRL
jgi:hypothetical protein